MILRLNSLLYYTSTFAIALLAILLLVVILMLVEQTILAPAFGQAVQASSSEVTILSIQQRSYGYVGEFGGYTIPLP